MKQLVFAMVFFFISNSYGQSKPIEYYAEIYKTSFPYVYKSLEAFAKEKWDKKKDINQEIYAQANAYTETTLLLTKEVEIRLPIFENAVKNNSKGNLEDVYSFKDNTVNWVQILIDLKKELGIEKGSIEQLASDLYQNSKPASQQSSGGGLNINGKSIRNGTPELYEAIKTFAINKWAQDHNMVLHEINTQSDAFIKFTEIMKSKPDEVIVMTAMKKWSDNFNPSVLANPTLDWRMVVHEIETQIKAKNSY